MVPPPPPPSPPPPPPGETLDERVPPGVCVGTGGEGEEEGEGREEKDE